MVQPDSTLGINVEFPTQTVRNALLFAMQMGKPAPDAQAKFIRKGTGVTYYSADAPTVPLDPATVRLDRDRKPLDPTIRMSTEDDDEIEVEVAIEMTEVPVDSLPVGNFRPIKATVTLMAQEYDEIQGCREMIFNGDRYAFQYELDSNGLFDLTFHTLIYFALGESV